MVEDAEAFGCSTGLKRASKSCRGTRLSGKRALVVSVLRAEGSGVEASADILWHICPPPACPRSCY